MIKKFIITISTIILCLFLGTVQANAISLGEIKSKGKAALGKTISIPGQTVISRNDLYCAQHNYLLKNSNVTGKTPKYIVKSYIYINGKTATAYFNNGTTKTSENNSNAIIARILFNKGGHGGWTSPSGTQKALWYAWNSFANPLGLRNSNGGGVKNSVYNTAYNYANYQITSSTTDITDKTVESNLTVSSSKIGPFKWTFSGSATISVKDNNGSSLTVYKSDKSSTTSSITSGSEYYIGVNSNSSNIIVTINNSVNLSTTKYTAKIWYLETTTKYKSYQNLILVTPGSTPSKESQTGTFEYVVSGKLLVKKEDADSREGLAGMTFKLTGPNGYSETFEMTDSDEILIENLTAGTYTITETKAPSGYDLNLQGTAKTKTVTVSNGKTSEVTLENKKYADLTIIKEDEEGNKIEGIGFYISTSNGRNYISSYTEGSPSSISTTSNKSNAELFLTNSEGKIVLENIPTGTYWYEEDTETMLKQGYLNEDGEEEGTKGSITIYSGFDYENDFKDLLKNNTFVSKAKSMTDTTLATTIYNSISSDFLGGSSVSTADESYRIRQLLGMEYNDSLVSVNGDTRYETAENISQALYPSSYNVTNVVLVNGETVNNAAGLDAVTAAAFASTIDAPILLLKNLYTDKTLSGVQIPQATKNELKRYSNLKNVYVIGVSGFDSSITSELKNVNSSISNVEFIAGSDRYVTSRLLADKARSNGGNKNSAFIIKDDSYVDREMIAGVSAWKQIPILYIKKDETNKVISDVQNYINTNNITTLYYIGGDASSGAFVDELTCSNEVEIAGTNRFETNQKIIKYFYGSSMYNIDNYILAEYENKYSADGTLINGNIDIAVASQLMRTGDMALILVPTMEESVNSNNEISYSMGDGSGYWDSIKSLINTKISTVLNSGTIYYFCSEGMLQEVSELVSKSYTATSMNTLINRGYDYEEYIDRVVTEIFRGRTLTEYSYSQIYSKLEDVFSRFGISTSSSLIDTYAKAMSGENIVTVKNKFDGRTLIIEKEDALNGRGLSAGFIIKNANGEYLEINGQSSIKNTLEIAASQIEEVSKNNATIIYTVNGKVEITKLKNEKYTVEEVVAPTGPYNLNFENDLEKTADLTNSKEEKLEFKNNPLGNLQIIKEDEDITEKRLAGVKFKIKNSSGKFLVIKDEESEITGNVTINSLSQIDYNGTGTTFITDSKGQITITNLPANVKYIVVEIENPNLGYVQLADDYKITSLDLDTYREKQITTPAKIGNEYNGGKLEIQKTDLVDSKIGLSAGFIIKNDEEKYLLINGKKEIKSTGTAIQIDTASYGIDYTTDRNNATVFYTGTNGKITLERLLVDTYYIEEVKSPGEVYPIEFQEVGPRKVNVVKNVTAEPVEFINTPVGNLKITKIDQDTEKKLPKVEIKIKTQKGYLKVNGQDIITGSVTINNPSEIEYDKTGTTFITGSEGEMLGVILINNLPANVQYTVQEINNPNLGYVDLSPDKTETLELDTKRAKKLTTPVTMNNDYNGGTLVIEKRDSVDERGLVAGFVIKNDEEKYLLIDGLKEIRSNGEEIDIDNANREIGYTENKANATVFYTGTGGKITLNRLLVDQYYIEETVSPSKAYPLKLQEVGPHPVNVEKKDTPYPLNLINTPVGDLVILKQDKDTEAKLANVEFKISKKGEKGYLVLNNKDKVTGTFEITELSQISYNGTGTTFVTDSNGQIEIENLPAGTYYIDEIKNNNPAYKDNIIETIEKTLNLDKERKEIVLTDPTIDNEQKYAMLSGYVWQDMLNLKDNVMNHLYYNNEQDILVAGIKVELFEEGVNNPIATTHTMSDNPNTQENETGKYIFNTTKEGKYLIDLDKLDKYYVRFTYDGLVYTSAKLNTTVANGSKAKEVAADRKNLNSKFNKVDLNKTNEAKTTMDKAVTATTKVAGYKLPTSNKNNSTIENINLGIVEREQPDLELTEELQNAEVIVNGYKHTYSYVSYKQNESASSIAVNFKNKELGLFTRPIYPSDIVLANQDNSKLEIYATYKITLTNNSDTLIAKVNQIVNYYDKNYTQVETKGGTFADNGEEAGYKKSYINLDGEIGVKGTKEITIKYKVSTDEVVKELLKGSYVLLNTQSEINSYTTLYGANSYEGSGCTKGQITAGLDQDSIPGNGKIKPDEDDGDKATAFKLQVSDHTRAVSGTVWNDEKSSGSAIGNGILDNTEKKIEKVKVELINASDANNPSATPVKTYKITDEIDEFGKYKTDDSGTATFTTGDNGEYTISGILPGEYVLRYTYSDGTTKIVGLNGDFCVRNYKSTILKGKAKDAEKGTLTDNDKLNWIQNENTRFNDASDSLSKRHEIDSNTSITYATLAGQNSYMYADTPAFVLGVELTTVSSKATESPAYYKKADGTFALIDYSEVKNIDFGIIERPRRNAEISKKITYIKVTLGNGQILIEGDPSLGAEITYVKTGLDGIVPMEIDFELLPATVELEYTISIKDTSEQDYAYKKLKADGSVEYYIDKFYKFGETDGVPLEQGIRINQVVDYLPSELIYDAEKTKEANGVLGDVWETKEAKNLKENGLINPDIESKLNSGYTILVTDYFGQFDIGQEKSVKLCATSKVTSSAKDLRFTNHTEIIDYASTTLITEPDPADPTKPGKISTPGNYDPSNSDTHGEADGDKIEYTITPPTGENKDYTIYYIISISALLVLGVGIVIIKKKVLK